jgi:hypothetical protein
MLRYARRRDRGSWAFLQHVFSLKMKQIPKKVDMHQARTRTSSFYDA